MNNTLNHFHVAWQYIEYWIPGSKERRWDIHIYIIVHVHTYTYTYVTGYGKIQHFADSIKIEILAMFSIYNI